MRLSLKSMMHGFCLAVAASFSVAATSEQLTVVPPPQPYPATGMWFDPEQPGTGFLFEVQNGILAGYYYLYDDEGLPIWYLVAGQLDYEAETGEGWVLETELERFAGGSCLGCPYQSPEVSEPGGEIRLTFPHRRKGRFQIDGGPEHQIEAFVHGVPVDFPFGPHSDSAVPDLEGQWVLESRGGFDADFGLSALNPLRGHAMVRLSRLSDDPPGELGYQVERLPQRWAGPDAQVEDFGMLHCGGMEAACSLETDEFLYSGTIPARTIGHDHLIYFWPSGHLSQAYRLSYALQPYEPSITHAPLPEPGIWFDPARPGTGFMFEVQDRQLAGYYFLYRPDGESLWFLIVGTLEPDSGSEHGWVMETELERYENGACLNCVYQPAEFAGTDGVIRLEFSGRSEGRFQVDDADWQDVRNFTYGVSLTHPFHEHGDVPMPELSGTWLLVFGEGEQAISEIAILYPNDDDDEEPQPHFSYQLEGVVALTGMPTPTPPPVTPNGGFNCFEDSSAGPICELNFLERVVNVRVADLSDSFFQGESGEGELLRAIRLDYD